MVEAFNTTFGYDERDIEAWGRMCVLVDMENIPEGLEARRQVSRTRFHLLFHWRHLSSNLQITCRYFFMSQAFASIYS